MGWRDILDERPLDPADVERVRALAGDVLGVGSVLVQAIGGAGARYVGGLRVIDLDAPREDSIDRAARVRHALREAGYDAQVRGQARSPWPDVEVTALRPAEWRRRRAAP